MLDQLQSLRKAVEPIAFDVYDRFKTPSILSLLAMEIDNTVAQEDPVSLEWLGSFAEMREWLDEKTTQKIFKGEFSIPIQGYEMTWSFDRKKLRRANALGASFVAQIQSQVERFAKGKLRLVMDVFRQNPLTYDGQNLFDAAHVHPSGKGTYSNLLTPNWVDPANPTIDEAKQFLHDAQARLTDNMGIDAEVMDAAEIDKNLVVTVHNSAAFSKFNLVRTMPRIDNAENEWMGGFKLLRDFHPTSGQESYLEVQFSAGTKGPRPVIFVIDEEPSQLAIDETEVFKRRKISMGFEAWYGVKAGWPQVVLQGQPS